MEYKDMKSIAKDNGINYVGKSRDALLQILTDKKLIKNESIKEEIADNHLLNLDVNKARENYKISLIEKEKTVQQQLDIYLWDVFDSSFKLKKTFVTIETNDFMQTLHNKDIMSKEKIDKIIDKKIYDDLGFIKCGSYGRKIFLYQNDLFVFKILNSYIICDKIDRKLEKEIAEIKSSYYEYKNKHVENSSKYALGIMDRLMKIDDNFNNKYFLEVLKVIDEDTKNTINNMRIYLSKIINVNNLNIIETIHIHTKIIEGLKEKGFNVKVCSYNSMELIVTL